MTLVGREAIASGKLELSLLNWKGLPLLATGVLCATGPGLLGEIHAEGCPHISSIALEKSPCISSAMLGLVAISLGHSVTECRVELGIDDH